MLGREIELAREPNHGGVRRSRQAPLEPRWAHTLRVRGGVERRVPAPRRRLAARDRCKRAACSCRRAPAASLRLRASSARTIASSLCAHIASTSTIPVPFGWRGRERGRRYASETKSGGGERATSGRGPRLEDSMVSQ
jgi:hypothetical protein